MKALNPVFLILLLACGGALADDRQAIYPSRTGFPDGGRIPLTPGQGATTSNSWAIARSRNAVMGQAGSANRRENLFAMGIYPSNPFLTDESIYLSGDGLTKYDRHSLLPQWRVLDGKELFETVVSNSVVVAGSSSDLYALDAATGGLVWKRAGEGRLFSPVVVGDSVYVASEDGHLHALFTESGETRWSRKFDGWVYPPALAAGLLVVAGQAGVLYGLDPKTGSVQWRSELPQEPVYRPQGVAGEYAVVTTFDGLVRMVKGVDGEIVWEARDEVASQPPVAYDGRLYFPGYDGVVRTRGERDGALLWQHRTHDALAFPPAVSNSLLIVGSPDGEVVALDRKNGAKRWSLTRNEELSTSPRLVDGRLLFFTRRSITESEAEASLTFAH